MTTVFDTLKINGAREPLIFVALFERDETLTWRKLHEISTEAEDS